MLETFGRIANRLADYTIGTVIVLVHVTLADRRDRLRLSSHLADGDRDLRHDLRTRARA